MSLKRWRVKRSQFRSLAVNADRQWAHRYRPRLEILEKRLAPTISLSISNPAPFPKADFGTSMGLFVVTRSGDLAPPVQVHYATQDGTAHAGTDYVATSGTLSFAANQTMATIAVPIIGNTLFEPNLTFTVALSNPLALATFSRPQTLATGTEPVAAAVGGFTGDGRLDLAVANFASNTVSVFLNQTTPGASIPLFSPPQTLATGSGPRALEVADVNGDGRPDLIVANAGADTVSVLLNQTPPGATVASFSPQQTFAAGAGPVSVAVGDLNGDGLPDLIVADVDANAVSVLLNQTAPGATIPSFGLTQPFATQAAPRSVGVGDINGDGRPDLIVANANADDVSVLLNQTPPGATVASFAPQQTFATGSAPGAVAVRDVNGDGRPDLIVADTGSGTVSVLLNQTPPGATVASFAPQQTFATGGAPDAVAIADVNGDRQPDLLVANEGSGTVSVLLNQTAPGATVLSFFPQQTFAAGSFPASVVVGDFNGDGQPDVMVADLFANTLSVLMNQATAQPGVATFTAVQTSPAGDYPSSVAVADVNGDGRPDLILTGVVLLNQAAPGATAPSFGPPQTFIAGPGPYGVAVGDLTGDGRPDLVVTNVSFGANAVSVLLNETVPGATVATFAPRQTFATGSHPSAVALGDVNGDGRLDLVVANRDSNTISVLLNQTAPGTTIPSFGPQQTFAVGTAPRALAMGDINGDGRPDVALANYGSNTVSVLLNQTQPGATTASFGPQRTFATGGEPHSVVLADVNGDGRPDLAVANYESNTVSVLLNQTTLGATVPSFALQQTFPTNSHPTSVAVGDVDGDGRPDLVVSNNYGSRTVSVLLNQTLPGAVLPRFAPQQTFPAGGPAKFVALGDLNGDGRPDVIVATSGAAVLLNTTSSISIIGSPATGTILDENAPASLTAFAGDNQFATVNTTFAAPLVVEVRNATGFLVQGVSVTFTVSRGSNGAAAAFNGNATVLTDASGHATAPPLVANTIAGSFTVTAVTTQGSQPLSVTFHLTNSPAATAALGVSAPPSVTAGTPFSITVTALDPYGNTVPSYTGTVAFFSTDANATLPANYPFTAGDVGVHTFAGVILRTTGLRFILADDTTNDQIGGFAPVMVVAAPARRPLVTGDPLPTTPGVSPPFPVTAADPSSANGAAPQDPAGTGEVTRTGNASALDPRLVSGILSQAASADNLWAPGSNPPAPPAELVCLDLLSGFGSLQDVGSPSGLSSSLPAAPSDLPKSGTTG